eukprot:1145870-Pelagomonas_calceolata.AAC.2
MPQWYSKGGPAAGKTSCCISISSLVIFSAKTAMRLFPFLPLLLETEVVSQASKHACSAASGAFKVPLTSPQCTQRHKRKGQHMQTYHNWNYLSNSGIFAGQLIFFITSECWSLHALVVVGLCAWVAWQRQVLMRISSMVPESNATPQSSIGSANACMFANPPQFCAKPNHGHHGLEYYYLLVGTTYYQHAESKYSLRPARVRDHPCLFHVI